MNVGERKKMLAKKIACNSFIVIYRTECDDFLFRALTYTAFMSKKYH